MTPFQTKEEFLEKVGKNSFLSDHKSLVPVLKYMNGIPSFDDYLDNNSFKLSNSVAHLILFPKGFGVKIIKSFSSFSYGLAFNEIKKTIISKGTKLSFLIFETTSENKITFSLKSSDLFDLKSFLNDINFKYEIENNLVENSIVDAITVVDPNPLPSYISVVSSLIIILGCFLPWLQLGAFLQNRGIDNFDGAFMLVVAIISGAVAVFNLVAKQNKNNFVFMICGIIGAFVFYIDYKEACMRALSINESLNKLSNLINDNSSNFNIIGSGLYIVLLGSLGLFLSGLGIFKYKN